MNENSGAIQAISTIVLVIITIFYTVYTKQMVNSQIKPILAIGGPFNHKSIASDNPAINLQNIGEGPATNIYIYSKWNITSAMFDSEINKNESIVFEGSASGVLKPNQTMTCVFVIDAFEDKIDTGDNSILVFIKVQNLLSLVWYKPVYIKVTYQDKYGKKQVRELKTINF